MFDKPKTETKIDEKQAEPKPHGSGNSTGTYFKVEVRSTFQPKVLQTDRPHLPFVIDDKWREWPMGLRHGDLHPSPSVPCRPWDTHAAEHGLLSYDAAMAHQWGVYALLDAEGFGALCIETRLVAIEFHESYALKEIGVSEPLVRPRRAADAFNPRTTE